MSAPMKVCFYFQCYHYFREEHRQFLNIYEVEYLVSAFLIKWIPESVSFEISWGLVGEFLNGIPS